jgi:hypothetical protein
MFIRLLIAAIVLLAAAPAVSVQAAPARKNTVTAMVPTPDDRARAWLVLVDDKNYAQSWSEGAPAFKGRRNAEAWAKQGDALRAPLGATASRNLKSIDLSRSNTAVIRYDSVFAHKAAAVETVTLTFQNGTWSVSDYAIQ